MLTDLKARQARRAFDIFGMFVREAKKARPQVVVRRLRGEAAAKRFLFKIFTRGHRSEAFLFETSRKAA